MHLMEDLVVLASHLVVLHCYPLKVACIVLHPIYPVVEAKSHSKVVVYQIERFALFKGIILHICIDRWVLSRYEKLHLLDTVDKSHEVDKNREDSAYVRLDFRTALYIEARE